MAVEGLQNPHDDDLKLLRAGRRGRRIRVLLILALVPLILLAIAVFSLVSPYGQVEAPEHLRQTIAALSQIEDTWAVELSQSLTSYHEWLLNHGTSAEVEIFERLGATIGDASLATITDGSSAGQSISWFSSLGLSIQSGVLRLGFLVLASYRLWIVVILASCAFGLRRYEPYKGDDVLGQTGNGRVFYSGVRAGLERLSASGAPDVLVRGFACPQAATSAQARASDIWSVLESYGAENETNEALCAIIVKNGEVASYVAAAGEEGALQAAYAGSSLAESTPKLLSVALALHSEYKQNQEIEAPFDARGPRAHTGAPLSVEQYAELLKSSFHRVLTPEMRRTIGRLSVAEVATAVLALEAGKVLAYASDGGRWTRRSNFVHLNARAVLHSVLSFPREYSFESRALIRRGIIYASRRSAFAPVRMPTDLTHEEWALRQWAELLLALPHELQSAADEVELSGLVREGHEAWLTEFFDRSILVSPLITSVSYVTPYNLLFVPFARLIEVLHKTLPKQLVERLHELATLVSARQHANAPSSEESGQGSASVDRVLQPLSQSDMESLVKLHGLSSEDLRAWSALRLILTGYSWLGRRVGDYTVPDSSVIFAVFSVDSSNPEANALGLVGKTGMVALRGGKLAERLGPSWSARFIAVNSATMAETQEDFEKAMQGIRDRDEAPEGLSEPLVGA